MRKKVKRSSRFEKNFERFRCCYVLHSEGVIVCDIDYAFSMACYQAYCACCMEVRLVDLYFDARVIFFLAFSIQVFQGMAIFA